MTLQEQGDIIAGKYRVSSLLGAGGLGEVFLCHDIETETPVAIKRLKNDITVPQAVIDQTQREAKILSSLRHRNIIRILDFGLDRKGFYFVLEFVDGPSLADVISQAPLPVHVFLNVASQSLEGLSAAHRKGLLHLDIKPANLMLHLYPSEDYVVKILDFGVAKFAEEAAQEVDEDEETFGSIFYISPEQLNQQPFDTRADIYSLGHVLYHSLTGHIAWPTLREPLDLVNAHLFTPPTRIEELVEGIDPELCEWIYWLLAKNPDDRPANAQAALAVLTKIILRLKKEEDPDTFTEELHIPEVDYAQDAPPAHTEVASRKKNKNNLFDFFKKKQ
ncbi:MAG: serine/threonine protein kinase [Blastochloris sp.]|nr:serine/threonine protein kinase [Blastochloris sp.]